VSGAAAAAAPVVPVSSVEGVVPVACEDGDWLQFRMARLSRAGSGLGSGITTPPTERSLSRDKAAENIRGGTGG